MWSTAGLRSGGDLCFVWHWLLARRDGHKGIRTGQAVLAVEGPDHGNGTTNDQIFRH